ncbi:MULTISPECIES: hypothetical protein [Enterobacteriaceae]|uniref:hypothetical protein n=1 Tax=Enterobacteriaceae TaxID=543 RepID=UPI0015F4F8D7|nr:MULTISPECIES: hypothetical protein [Enterobacteriaceae]QMT08932.1 hypothetical protein H1R18_26070 [Enterobacter kobei]
MAGELDQPAGTESPTLDGQGHRDVPAPAGARGPHPGLAEKGCADGRRKAGLSGVDGDPP